MRNLDEIQSGLGARLSELKGRARHIRRDLTEPMSADADEQAVEQEDDDVLAAEDGLVLREIRAIEAAIARIDDGDYGQCTGCGGAIAETRLAAQPEAALCIACAQGAEQGAR
jgi:RNA polymerase-binding transcription factor DksA